LKSLRYLCSAVLALAVGLAAARAEPTVPLSAVIAGGSLTLEAAGNGRDELTLTLRNRSATAIGAAIPAGLIAAGAKPETRMIVLRAAVASVPAHGTADVALPVAALSSKNVAAAQPFTVTTASEPRLTALLAALADQPDAPRSTAQLAILALLENLSFAQWRQFRGLTAETPPTPAEVTQAIDALGLLRTVAPQQTFALAQDSDLKARALRNPWCRAKAMAVYGLDFGDGAVPPDLRQLLHTQPGDNCPICRQRALMQKPAEIP
jgi:hypothetical protein